MTKGKIKQRTNKDRFIFPRDHRHDSDQKTTKIFSQKDPHATPNEAAALCTYLPHKLYPKFSEKSIVWEVFHNALKTLLEARGKARERKAEGSSTRRETIDSTHEWFLENNLLRKCFRGEGMTFSEIQNLV